MAVLPGGWVKPQPLPVPAPSPITPPSEKEEILIWLRFLCCLYFYCFFVLVIPCSCPLFGHFITPAARRLLSLNICALSKEGCSWHDIRTEVKTGVLNDARFKNCSASKRTKKAINTVACNVAIYLPLLSNQDGVSNAKALRSHG